VLDRYLYPWFDNVRLRDLTAPMVRARILELGGRVDPVTGKAKSLTLKSARNILTPLQAMLSLAVDDGKIPSNPVGRMALARHWPTAMISSDWEADPFAWNELEAIFEACEDGPHGAEADYWRFAVGTGLRPSEQIALTWERCDLLNLRIKVAVARVTGHQGPALKQPKTKAGKRDVDLTAGAWEALQRQKARTFLAGGAVFLDPRTGAEWRTEETLRKRWVRILRKAGVRYRNPYQTRHTFVSSLLGAGVPPLWVARQVGHATVEMLERNYGRWIDQGSSDHRQLIAFFSHASPAAQRRADAFPLRR
jgi:integrase